MTTVIRTDDDVNFTKFDINHSGYLECDGKPIYFQTPFFDNYKLRSKYFYPTILKRSYIKCELKSENKFYKDMDKFFMEKLIDNVYKSFSDSDNLSYFLKCGRIPKNEQVLQDITDSYQEQIEESKYDITKSPFLLMMERDNELDKDEYYDYVYQYKLYNRKQEIKFDTFDEFISHITPTKEKDFNMRFIFRPKLIISQYNGENTYSVRLDIFRIEINKK
jgi:hypothetical protein